LQADIASANHPAAVVRGAALTVAIGHAVAAAISFASAVAAALQFALTTAYASASVVVQARLVSAVCRAAAALLHLRAEIADVLAAIPELLARTVTLAFSIALVVIAPVFTCVELGAGSPRTTKPLGALSARPAATVVATDRVSAVGSALLALVLPVAQLPFRTHPAFAVAAVPAALHALALGLALLALAGFIAFQVVRTVPTVSAAAVTAALFAVAVPCATCVVVAGLPVGARTVGFAS